MKRYAGIGSRKTPLAIQDVMTDIAKYLNGIDYWLVSGAAEGADQAFERGAGYKKEIWLPEKGWHGHRSELIVTRDAYELAEDFHPAWDYLDADEKALIARDGHQVLGADLETPVDFIICWTPDGKMKGGTAQALRLAKAYKIPYYNMGDRGASYDTLLKFLETYVRA
ncbi:hypothetical protein CPT_Marzo_087 [Stenotrophomonas phage Marzo]|nr:hypothetical protein CPT_Marzo_087 [Stenotrophomonas phage Marzo]